MIKKIKVNPLTINKVIIKGSFWSAWIKTVHDVSIPYQWDALNDNVPGAVKSNAVKNFKIAAGEIDDEFSGRVFQDTDLYKWIEAVGNTLVTDVNPKLEQIADQVIDLIGKAQQPDGYVNTYFTVKEPKKRWTNLRDQHELYCAGHMIEAAVSYYTGTGKRKFLDIACRFADYIDSVFGTDSGKIRGYDGHEEIELALVRLYEVTEEKKYLDLGKYFVDERGNTPHFFDLEKEKRGESKHPDPYKWPYYMAHLYEYDYSYHQAKIPVRKQTTADGHAVRAMYLYSGMIDIAARTDDGELYTACKKIWESIIERRMYITGGIGSIGIGEAFTFDYDLPNEKAYTETCAAIGLIFFAHRLLQYEVDHQYSDIIERILYNGALSGISLDGTQYFYVNPLEVWPQSINERKDNFKHRLRATRQEWYGTACCPPNIARLISSLGQYFYSYSTNGIFVHQYADGEANFEIQGRQVTLNQKTSYPWDEHVEITVNPSRPELFFVAIRIPGWCKDSQIKVNGEVVNIKENIKKGYAYINREWHKGDKIDCTFYMKVERIQANTHVRMNAGKIALQRGPIIYCIEEVDNGPILTNISIPRNAQFNLYFDQELLGGVTVLTTEGLRDVTAMEQNTLYQLAEHETNPVKIQAVPYFSWCNRAPGEMLVWIRTSELTN